MATGEIRVIDPSGRTGTMRIISVDSGDHCPNQECIGQEVEFSSPVPSGAGVGTVCICKVIVLRSGGAIIIDLRV